MTAPEALEHVQEVISRALRVQQNFKEMTLQDNQGTSEESWKYPDIPRPGIEERLLNHFRIVAFDAFREIRSFLESEEVQRLIQKDDC